MRDYAEYSGIARRIRLLAIVLETAYGAKAGHSLCVDAADAIEELLAEVKHWELEAAANETDRNYLIDENRKLVNSLMNFRVPTWISVDERLPEEHVDVLICTEDYGKNVLGFAMTAVWDGTEWIETWDKNNSICCVTHWMPLPEPPKEDTP